MKFGLRPSWKKLASVHTCAGDVFFFQKGPRPNFITFGNEITKSSGTTLEGLNAQFKRRTRRLTSGCWHQTRLQVQKSKQQRRETPHFSITKGGADFCLHVGGITGEEPTLCHRLGLVRGSVMPSWGAPLHHSPDLPCLVPPGDLPSILRKNSLSS